MLCYRSKWFSMNVWCIYELNLLKQKKVCAYKGGILLVQDLFILSLTLTNDLADKIVYMQPKV